MEEFTATITLDADQRAFAEQTAAYFRVPLQTFLEMALHSGISHAEDMFIAAVEAGHEDGPTCRCGACVVSDDDSVRH